MRLWSLWMVLGLGVFLGDLGRVSTLEISGRLDCHHQRRPLKGPEVQYPQ